MNSSSHDLDFDMDDDDDIDDDEYDEEYASSANVSNQSINMIQKEENLNLEPDLENQPGPAGD
jgi:hypothetical protein